MKQMCHTGPVNCTVLITRNTAKRKERFGRALISKQRSEWDQGLNRTYVKRRHATVRNRGMPKQAQTQGILRAFAMPCKACFFSFAGTHRVVGMPRFQTVACLNRALILTCLYMFISRPIKSPVIKFLVF